MRQESAQIGGFIIFSKDNNKHLEQFLIKCAQLSGPEFAGICRILGVNILNGEDKEKLRPFDEVIKDVTTAYKKLNRKARRNLDKILKEATKNGPKS